MQFATLQVQWNDTFKESERVDMKSVQEMTDQAQAWMREKMAEYHQDNKQSK